MDRIDSSIPKIVPRELAPNPGPAATSAAATPAPAAPSDTFAGARPAVVSPFAPSAPPSTAAPAPLPAFSAAAAAREVSTGTTARMLGIAGLALLAIGGVAAGSAQAQTFPTVPSVPLPFGQSQQVQPSGPNESFDDFIARMRAAKQQAQREAQQQGRPTQPNQGQGQTRTNVGVTVTAHSFYSGNRQVGVSNIRIAESGDYSNRTSQSFTSYGGSSTQGLRLDSGHPGKYYNVYVTWADGSSQTYSVRADNGGARLDAWKY